LLAYVRIMTPRFHMRACAVALITVTLVTAVLVSGCEPKRQEEPRMTVTNAREYKQVALEFTRALASRNYPAAYAMTSRRYRSRVSLEQMRALFEQIVPQDWGTVGPIEVGETMEQWPGKQPPDVGWAYVSIGGDVYSEAVTVVLTQENSEMKVGEVEFGRP
jgi:hypothetical protein